MLPVCYPHPYVFEYAWNNVPCHQVCIEFTSPLRLLVRSIRQLHVAPYPWPQLTEEIGNDKDARSYRINFFFTITKRLRIAGRL